MPTFPDDPDTTPPYAKPFVQHIGGATIHSAHIRWTNIRPIQRDDGSTVRKLLAMMLQVPQSDIKIR